VVLEHLTPAEQARHERGIERIRRRLFRRYRPDDYFIVPNSEQVLAGSAESCWNAACGEYRVFRVGGLSYAVDCQDSEGMSRLAVLHADADRFSFWVTAARGHTMVSLTVRFRELDEIVYAYVCSFRRSNTEPAYTGKADDLIDF
jgi:hypothetical protein